MRLSDVQYLRLILTNGLRKTPNKLGFSKISSIWGAGGSCEGKKLKLIEG